MFRLASNFGTGSATRRFEMAQIFWKVKEGFTRIQHNTCIAHIYEVRKETFTSSCSFVFLVVMLDAAHNVHVNYGDVHIPIEILIKRSYLHIQLNNRSKTKVITYFCTIYNLEVHFANKWYKNILLISNYQVKITFLLALNFYIKFILLVVIVIQPISLNFYFITASCEMSEANAFQLSFFISHIHKTFLRGRNSQG